MTLGSPACGVLAERAVRAIGNFDHCLVADYRDTSGDWMRSGRECERLWLPCKVHGSRARWIDDYR